MKLIQCPLTIPPEIMTLKNGKLPTKLLLTMVAADPNVKDGPLRRALGISRAGYEKLKRRTVQQGWLTESYNKTDTRYRIHVPGLAYHSNEDHYLPEKLAAHIEKKVIPSSSTTQPVESVAAITLPAEILDLKDVAASEKFLLSVYTIDPMVTNGRLMNLLGLSRAGVKKVRHRLVEGGFLTMTDAGYRVHVPGLVYIESSEGGYYLSESEAIKTGKIVAPATRKITPVADVFIEWQKLISKFEREPKKCLVSTLQFITASCIKQLINESPDSPERDLVLGHLKHHENLYYLWQFICDHCPKSKWKDALTIVGHATPEQLAAYREKAEVMTLAGIQPQKLLGFFDVARPAAAGTNGANGSQQPRSGSQTPSGSKEAK